MPVTALLFTSGNAAVPLIPASNKRCPPAKQIYPPTVPPTRVTMAVLLMVLGKKLCCKASTIGGCELTATNSVSNIISIPKIFANWSIILPASFIQKIKRAIPQLIMAP